MSVVSDFNVFSSTLTWEKYRHHIELQVLEVWIEIIGDGTRGVVLNKEVCGRRPCPITPVDIWQSRPGQSSPDNHITLGQSPPRTITPVHTVTL